MSRLSQLLVMVCIAGALVGTSACTKVPPKEPLAPLVEALGGRRLLELRLTGGFIYAPCQSSPSTSGL
ncbi:MAG TPA: hypothetical protein VLX28_00075, partial [Thermoanaerobaculia bacterium]|nr:hypothetical protein [Thermoanaerobaculia bacterium]